MNLSVVTSKGRVVIPLKMRQHLNITKGTKISIEERVDGLIVTPINSKYFEKFAGILPGRGKAIKSLLKDRQIDKR
ncbi:MAG: hypothetical protein A2231_10340 [Candidatus Firestonebacteria bacterium RIFOXYA2_FULL_40_8]|nr:MAG: hypothetical protein A2231_10340 [Candidatus Firestonebacteria bacterium RIFOXYA2_FULL_40_8]